MEITRPVYHNLTYKSMKESRSDWNYHEFKVYLLLYAAYSDFDLAEEEKKKILANATKEEYQVIHKVFEKHSDVERIETILSFREQFFPTEKKTETLIAEVAEFLNVDEDLNLYERNFFAILQKILRSYK